MRVVAAVLLATAVAAVPVKRDIVNGQCAERCTGVQNKYAYEVGKAYTYELRSHTDVHVPNQNSHSTNITSDAVVDVLVHAPCEFELIVKSIAVTGVDADTDFEEKMRAQPVRFAFDDGVISSVCPTPEEETWALNIKLGIIAAFQNAWEADDLTVTEEDVAGRCRSTYRREKHGDDWMYHRKKHAGTCRGHHHMHGAMRAHPYDVQSDIESSMTNNGHECKHTVGQNGILKSASCKEWHSFTPFTNVDSTQSITSTTRSRLTLVGSPKSITTKKHARFSSRRTLAYDVAELDYAEQTGSKADADAALKTLCESSELYIVKETPAQFVRLVRALRGMKKTDLVKLVKSTKSKGICDSSTKFLLDALPMCGSESCVRAMVEVMETAGLSTREKSMWFTSLAFVPKATAPMIEAVLPLADSTESPSTLLGLSSLVHTYCSQHLDCVSEPTVEQLISKLMESLGEKCEVEDEPAAIEKMVVTLKALGNIGELGRAAETVMECARHTVNPIAVRVAAVQATRRLSCVDTNRDGLMALFRNKREDVEVRINAFLSLVKCPTTQVIKSINHQLEKEDVYQVGSFVWSYLKERAQSDDPTQKHLRHLIQQHPTTRRFDQDPKQYSRYYETGKFSQSANTGAHVENGVVYTPGSYTPRSAFANLTVHMFGHSVNFIEIGGRAEGLDHFLDNLFGAEGVLDKPSDFYNKNRALSSENSADYDELTMDFERRTHYERRERLALSTYVRVFGDELAYLSIDDPQIMDTVRANTDYRRLVDALSTERKMSMSKNIVFMDFSKSLPTSGLPVRLHITGAASMKLDMSGKADLSKMMTAPHDIDIKSDVRPSAAIDISTTLTVNVGQARSGFRLRSRMHTSTAFQHKLEMRNRRVFKAVLGLPQDSMKLVDFEVTGFGVVGEKEMHITDASTFTESQYCTPEAFSNALGVSTCIGSHKPNGAHIFPKRYWVSVDKTDSSLKEYEARLELAENLMPRRLSLNTPNSNIDRELSVQYDYVRPAHVFEVKAPGHKYNMEFKPETNTDEKKSGKLLLTVDDSDKYELDTQIKYMMTENGGAHRELKAVGKKNGGAPITFVTFMKGNMATMHAGVKLEGVNDEPTELTLKTQMHNGKYAVKFDWQCAKYINKMHATAEHRPAEFKLLLDAEHSSVKELYEPVTFKVELGSRREQKGDVKKVTQTLELSKSVHPASNLRMVVVHSKTKSKGQKIDAELKYGAGLVKTASGVIETKRHSGSKTEYVGEVSVPEIYFEHKLIAKLDNQLPRHVHADVALSRVDGSHKKTAMLKFTRNSSPFKLDAEAAIRVPHSNIDWKLTKKIEQTQGKKATYRSETMVRWAPERELNVDADIKVHHTFDEFDYVVDAVGRVSGFEEPIKVHKTAKITPKTYKMAAALTRGNTAVYDVELGVVKAGQNKHDFNGKLASHLVSEEEWTMKGSSDVTSEERQMDVDVLKSGTQVAQLSVVLPVHTRVENKKRVYVLGKWNMDTKVSMVRADYSFEKDSARRMHKLHAVSKMAGEREYDLSSVITRSDAYMMNNTLKINGKERLLANWGVHKTNDLYKMDAEFKSDLESTGNVHKSAAIVAINGEKKHQLHADITCHVSNKKLLGEIISESPKASHSVTSMRVEAGDFKMSLKSKSVKKTETGHHFAVTSSMQWADDKRIVYNNKVEYNPHKYQFTYEDSLSTPFESMRVWEGKATYKCEELKCTYQLKSKFNDETFSLESMRLRDEDGNTGEYTLKLKKQPGADKDAVFSIKRITKPKQGLTVRDVDALLQWFGQDNRLRAHYSYGATAGYKKAEYTAVVETKIADIELDTKARYDYKINGHKHIVAATMKNKNKNYMLSGDFDTKTNVGSMKVQTPNKDMRSAAIKVTKISENEFKIETEHNGEDGATVVGTVKSQGQKRLAVLRIENVENPLEIDAGFAVHGTDKHIKLVVTTNAGTADKKSFGVDVVHNPTKLAATLVYPKRRPHIELRKNNNVMELWLQSDVNGRAPTKFIVSADSSLYEIALEDPALAHRLVSQVGWQFGKQCPEGADSSKCFSGKFDWNVRYSNKPHEKFSTTSVVKVDDESNILFESILKHPKSKYHQHVIVRAVERGTEDIYGLSMQVENEQGSMEKYNYELAYDKTTRHSNIKVVTPSGQHTVKYEKVEREVRIMVLAADADKPSYVLALGIEGTEYYAELRRSATSDVILHVKEGLVDPKTFESRMWHKDGSNKKHNDLHFKLWLQRDDLLRVRMHVTPEAWNNLIASMANADASVSTDVESAMLLTIMKSHKRGMSAVAEGVSTQFAPLRAAWQEERAAFNEDMGEELSEVYSVLYDYVEMLGRAWTSYIEIIDATMAEWADSETMTSLRETGSGLRQSLIGGVRTVGTMLRETYTGIVDALSRFAEHVNAMVAESQEFLAENAYFGKISSTLNDLWRTMKSWASYDDINQTIDSWMDEASSKYAESSEWYSQWLDTVMDYSVVRAVYTAVQPGVDELMSFDVRAVVNGLLEYGKEIVDGNFLNRITPKVNVYKPEIGLVELELPLPVKARSLAELLAKVEPERMTVYLHGMKQRLARIFSASGMISEEMWQSVGDRRPAKSDESMDWSEAHFSTAYVMGDRHVVTFDGRVVSLTSQCEYLFAHDFLTNKFTVTGKYGKKHGRTVLEHLKVETRGKDIAVHHNGQVTVDGQHVELPYQLLDTFEGASYVKVLRKDHSIVLTTFDGVRIDCDLYNSFCAVELDGRFHGHSNGLLGTNDNEPFNDFDTPAGIENSDVAKFANHWAIGGGCKAEIASPNAPAARQQECDDLFRMRSSPLRSCFRRIAPRAFHSMCMYDKCNATAAYVHACNEAGLSLEQPTECLTCSTPTDNIHPGNTVEVMANNIVKGVDIVFAVEERSCMSFIKDQLVNKVANKIVAKAGAAAKHARFGVIGFGGEDVHFEPHFHTGNGNEINFDKNGLKKAVDALEFEHTMSEGWKDPITAVDFIAKNYPFRPTVVKTIVLLTCGECGYEVDYYDVQERLLSNGIQMHVYTTQSIEINDLSEREFIGFDAVNMYSMMSDDDAEARKNLQGPHDSCTVLAQEVFGSVWTLYNEDSSVFSMPAEKIGTSISKKQKENKCEVCECDAYAALVPRTRCFPCEITEPASLSAPSFFNNPVISLRNTLNSAQKSLSTVDAWLV